MIERMRNPSRTIWCIFVPLSFSVRLKSHGPLCSRLIGIAGGALAAVGLLGLVACGVHSAGTKPPPPKPWEVPQNAASPEQVKWAYEPGGLTLHLKADPELNLFEGFSHNLVLCMYQLTEPAPFQELAANPGGIRKLLECVRFDPTVVHVERRFISPGQEASLVMDRAEGARHFALVAGYNHLQPGLVTTLYSFPVTASRAGWLPWSAPVYNPERLTMNIILGSNSIQRLGVE